MTAAARRPHQVMRLWSDPAGCERCARPIGGDEDSSCPDHNDRCTWTDEHPLCDCPTVCADCCSVCADCCSVCGETAT
jgi:hypothetical protein